MIARHINRCELNCYRPQMKFAKDIFLQVSVCPHGILQKERNNSYYFSRANQQKVGIKIYSLTECGLTVNEFDWHILAGNDKRINSHCLSR